MANTKIDLGRQATAKSDVDVNSQKIIGLADPTQAQHAATKAYVDAHAQGFDVKESCRVATTENVNLSTALAAGQVIDGVPLVEGDRVLVKNQTDKKTNGIYVSPASGAASRAPDCDADSEVTQGLFVFVAEGTQNASKGFVLTTADPITIGTTELTFSQITATADIVAGNGLVKTGNTLDVGAGDGVEVAADSVAVKLDGGSLAKSGNGLKVANTGITEAMLNTSVAGNGIAGGGGTALSVDVVTREVPSGSINGTNKTFTLANTPVLGTEMVYLNGVLQNAGGNDYSINGATISMTAAPLTGDVLLVTYYK